MILAGKLETVNSSQIKGPGDASAHREWWMQQHLCLLSAVSLAAPGRIGVWCTWLSLRTLVTFQSFSFFSLPLEHVNALNVFRLYCDRFSWSDFLSGKNKVSRSGYMCHHLARGDYVPSKTHPKMLGGLVWVAVLEAQKKLLKDLSAKNQNVCLTCYVCKIICKSVRASKTVFWLVV